MEIITVGDRKFVVVEKVSLENFSSQERINEYFKGKVYLRKPDSPIVIVVNETVDVKFEDLPLINEVTKSEQIEIPVLELPMEEVPHGQPQPNQQMHHINIKI